MMYLIFNENGALVEKNLNEIVVQGSNNVAELGIHIKGVNTTTYAIMGICTLPNNEKVIIQPSTTVKQLRDDIYGPYFKLSDEVTSLAGTVKINIQAIRLVDNKVITSYTVYLLVNDGVNPGDVAMMSVQQYQSLVEQIERDVQYEETIVTMSGNPVGDFGYEEGQIVYCFNPDITTINSFKRYKLVDDQPTWETIVDFTSFATKSELSALELTLSNDIELEAQYRYSADQALGRRIDGKSTVSGTVVDGKWFTLTIDGLTYELGTTGTVAYEGEDGIVIEDNKIKTDPEVIAYKEDIAQKSGVSFFLDTTLTIAKLKTYLNNNPSTVNSIYIMFYNSTTKKWEKKTQEVKNGDYDGYTIINSSFESQNATISGVPSQYIILQTKRSTESTQYVGEYFYVCNYNGGGELITWNTLIQVIQENYPDRYLNDNFSAVKAKLETKVIATGGLNSIAYSQLSGYKVVFFYGYKENVSAPNQFMFAIMPDQLAVNEENYQAISGAGPNPLWQYGIIVKRSNDGNVYWWTNIDYSSNNKFTVSKIVGVR